MNALHAWLLLALGLYRDLCDTVAVEYLLIQVVQWWIEEEDMKRLPEHGVIRVKSGQRYSDDRVGYGR